MGCEWACEVLWIKPFNVISIFFYAMPREVSRVRMNLNAGFGLMKYIWKMLGKLKLTDVMSTFTRNGVQDKSTYNLHGVLK